MTHPKWCIVQRRPSWICWENTSARCNAFPVLPSGEVPGSFR